MEMKGDPVAMNPGPGFQIPENPAQGFPPAGYPTPGYPGYPAYPGYPPPDMQPPYAYGQVPQGAFQGGQHPQGAFQGGQHPQGAFQGPPGQPPYVAYGGPHPIQNQPMGPGPTPSAWMPVPETIPNCPPGLEYLSQSSCFIYESLPPPSGDEEKLPGLIHREILIDQLLVHQQVELLEALTGFETNNKYEIKNSMGQKVYFAAEENDCCNRNFCGSARSFAITIVDNTGREIIRLHRPLRCSSCCFPCCLQKLEVEAPPGNPIGYVVQNWHPCLPKFTIQNEKGENVLKIRGPCIPCSCCSDVNFEIKTLDETSVVGKISKQWTGLIKESFTDADNFGVQFPMDLDVKIKAVVLGALFLIDFMFFEHSDKKN